MNCVSKRDCNMCLEPQLTNLSLHAALTKKRKISDSSVVIGLQIVHIRTTVFELCVREKKERRRKEEQRQIFHVQFVRRINGTLEVYFTLE